MAEPASGAWSPYIYNARGAVTDNGRIAFTLDYNDQATGMGGTGTNGSANGSFVYDGNLKRVKQVQGGKTIYSVYSQAGALVYRDNVTDGETTAYLGQGIRLVNSIPDYTHNRPSGQPRGHDRHHRRRPVAGDVFPLWPETGRSRRQQGQ